MEREYLYIRGRVDDNLVDEIYKALRSRKNKDSINIILSSSGGLLGSAYKIINLLWDNANEHVNVYVLDRAKSAGTFICLGCSKIYLSSMGELGPIDPQVRTEGDRDVEQFSVLSHQQAVKECVDISIKFFVEHARFISGLKDTVSLHKRLSLATEYAAQTANPLLAQIDPLRLAEYSNTIQEITRYFKLLIERHKLYRFNTNLIETVEKLIHDIPTHSFVIDFYHLKKLGLNIEHISDDLYNTLLEERHKILKGNIKKIENNEPVVEYIKMKENGSGTKKNSK